MRILLLLLALLPVAAGMPALAQQAAGTNASGKAAAVKSAPVKKAVPAKAVPTATKPTATKPTAAPVRPAATPASPSPAVSANLGGALEEVKAQAGRAERLIGEAEKALADMRLQAERPDIDEQQLTELRKKLDALNLRLLSMRNDLKAPMENMRQQLAALGPPPKDGAAEDPAIAARRAALSGVSQRLQAADRQLGLLIVEGRQLAERIGERQRALFFSEVLKPARSVLNPLLWWDGIATLPDFASRLTLLAAGWLKQDTGRLGVLVALSLLLAALALILYLWRQWRGPWEAGERAPDEVRRMWQAVRVPLFVAIITGLLLLLINITIFTFGAPSPRVERLLSAFAAATMYIAVLTALARGIFRPRTPHMRLVDIADESAARAYRLAVAIAALHGLDLFITRIAPDLFLPVAFQELTGAVVAMLHVALTLLFIRALRGARALSEAQAEQAPGHFLFGWVRYAFHLALLLLLLIVLALLFGYIALAHFIARQMVFTAALAAALYLLHHLADALVKSAFDPRSHVGSFLRANLLVSESTIARAGVVFSTLVDITTVLVGLPLILMQWAVNWLDVLATVRQLFFGFKVGNIVIEPVNILLGLVVFLIGLGLVRLFIIWLERRVLARAEMDDGIRHSLLTVARYTGIVGAFLVGISVAGVNLASLALFGGALGIGIGFGLQTIVNNFVSGLILLAERPIKAGDWIKTSGGEGVVRRIKVRSTEIETFDRCTIIIPNSQLISEPVSNWFHATRMGRVRLPVGVSYDADPEVVSDILLKCAKAHPRALANPAPFVLFTGFGESSLDFELRVYIGDAGYMTSTASDLRYAIFRELRQAGIEIPFPQRDLHIRELPADMFDRGALPGQEDSNAGGTGRAGGTGHAGRAGDAAGQGGGNGKG